MTFCDVGSPAPARAVVVTVGGVTERDHGPYVDMADLVRRTGITPPQVEALATAGAFNCFGLLRRQALWGAGRAAEAPDQLREVAAPR